MDAGPDAAEKLRELELLAATMPMAIDAATVDWIERTKQQLERAHAPSPYDQIWQAFWRLNDERPQLIQGMAQPMGIMLIKSVPQRIPWSSVARWCEVYGLDLEMAERCILAMDAIYLKDWSARNVTRG